MSKQDKTLLDVLDYPVPKHANSILYMFGGISLTAFLILMASGIYLSQFYSPTTDGAHQSITRFITDAPLADFMRGLHFWTANLVVALLLIHVIRVFSTGSYKNPRRLTWLTGVALLATTVIYIFIGTVLKWDQEGVEALGHMQESFKLLGIHIGLTNFGVPVITQLYSWHTTILLMALLGLLALHMLLIKLRGISQKPDRETVSAVTAGQDSSSFLQHLCRLSGFGLLFLGVAGLLALLSPAPIGQPGIIGQEVTKPLWMFWPFFGLENIFGLKGLVWGMAGFFAILAAVPFIDRSPSVHWTKRLPMMAFGLVFAVLVIGLGVYAQLAPSQSHLGMAMTTPSSQMEMASADDVKLDHQELYREGLWLAPILIVIGAVGAGLANRR